MNGLGFLEKTPLVMLCDLLFFQLGPRKQISPVLKTAVRCFFLRNAVIG